MDVAKTEKALKRIGLVVQDLFSQAIDSDSFKHGMNCLIVYLNNGLRPPNIAEFIRCVRSKGLVVTCLVELLNKTQPSVYRFIDDAFGYLNEGELDEMFKEKYGILQNSINLNLLLNVITARRDIVRVQCIVNKVDPTLFTQMQLFKMKTIFFDTGLLHGLSFNRKAFNAEFEETGLTLQDLFRWLNENHPSQECLQYLSLQGLKLENYTISEK